MAEPSHLCPDGAPGPCDAEGNPLGHHDRPVFLERPGFAVLLFAVLCTALPILWAADTIHADIACLFAGAAAAGQGRTVYGLARVGATVAEHERQRARFLDRIAAGLDVPRDILDIGPHGTWSAQPTAGGWADPDADPLGDMLDVAGRYQAGPQRVRLHRVCGQPVHEFDGDYLGVCTEPNDHQGLCAHEPWWPLVMVEGVRYRQET